MIQLEILNSENEKKLLEIQRADIPASFVEEVQQTIELARYGEEENLKGHCYGIKNDSEYVGIILIGEGIEGEPDPEEVKGRFFYRILGFVIDQRYRNLGIGREALSQAIAHVFQEYGDAPVLLECNQLNHKAIAFYKRLGFIDTKHLHGDDVYLLYPQITLQEFTLDALHTYYRSFEADADVYMDLIHFVPYQYQPKKVDAYYASKQEDIHRKNFMIMCQDSPIGELSLKHIDYEKKECELSIHMQSNRVKNKGYGTLAEKQAIKYAFEILKMDRVLANCVLKNTRSQHILEKIGFEFVRHEGIFKYYLITKEIYYTMYGLK